MPVYLPTGTQLPSHLRWDAEAGRPLDAKSFGAIGTGVSHFITGGDIADHPEWFDADVCRYTAGVDTWDFVGIQECIYSAYGTPGAKNSYEASHLNREVYVPAGDYRINRRLMLVDAIGVVFAGAGRFTTKIGITVPDEPVLETNMVYSVIRDLMFQYLGGQAQPETTAVVEWTWDGGLTTSAGGLAQLSVYDCEFHGGGYADTLGFRCARDGPQGDNLVFHNCFFSSCFYAGFATGEGAQNALNMVFDTCNFQRCPLYGIITFGGNVIVIGGSFQNGQVSAAEKQKGWDIRLVSSANSASSIYGCRTESRRFLHADSSHSVDARACSVITSPAEWEPGVSVVVGDIRAALSSGLNQDGRVYVCGQAGTTGSVEPEWDGSSVGVVDQSLVPVVWALHGVGEVGTPTWAPATDYAVGALVRGVLHDDGNDYVCVVAGTSGGPTSSSEPLWSGDPGIEDGTALWFLYNYNVLEFDNGTIENCSLPWGQVTVGQAAPCRLVNNIFSRDDWLFKVRGPAETNLGLARHYNQLNGNQVVHAGGINNGTAVPYKIASYGEPDLEHFTDHVTAYSHFYLPGIMPLLWARKALLENRAARDVGFWPPEGRQADASNDDLSRNVVGIIGALAPRHAEGANVAGADLLIQGGLGTGTGASGLIRLRTAAAGAAGSDVNNPHATVDALALSHQRVQSGLFFRPLSVTTAQRGALTGMHPGDQVWDVTEGRLKVWNGFSWDSASTNGATWDPLTAFGVDLQAFWNVNDLAFNFSDAGITGAVADGPIGRIADQSGNGHHLDQTGGARSVLKLDIAEGRAVARHNGIDQFMLTDAFNRYPGANTVVIICRSYTAGGFIFAPVSPVFVGDLYHYNLGTQLTFAYGTNMLITGDVATQFGTAICTYAGASSEAWLNGVRFATALSAGGDPKGLVIAARGGGSSFNQLDFAAGLVVSRDLTADEVDRINIWANPWGTPEPYYNA